MILLSKNFLFVHNPKTAGTSLIQLFLRAIPGAKAVGVEALGSYHPHLDQALAYWRLATGSSGAPATIAVVVRDPFDREISMYIHLRDKVSLSITADRNLNDLGLAKATQIASSSNFQDYIQNLDDIFGTCDIWRSRYYYRSEMGNEIEGLKVLRFASLESDVRNLMQSLALEAPPLPHLNVGERRSDYRYYNEKTSEIVRRSYGWMLSDGVVDR